MVLGWDGEDENNMKNNLFWNGKHLDLSKPLRTLTKKRIFMVSLFFLTESLPTSLNCGRESNLNLFEARQQNEQKKEVVEKVRMDLAHTADAKRNESWRLLK